MPTLPELINNLTVSDLKELLDYIPGAIKIGRKDILTAAILQPMSGAGLQGAWDQLDHYQRLAVAEATHDAHGMFNGTRFAAKYGQRPAFHHRRGEGHYERDGAMTVLGLFFYQLDGYYVLPTDLQARLKAIVPKPAANALACAAALPAPDAGADAAPMTVRATAPDALHDVVVLLRAVDQGLIAVSDKTHLPGVAGLRVVLSKIVGGDFYDTAAPKDKWEQPIGPIKAVARGETAVSISFVHDGPGEKMQGFPVETVTPADGTGAEIGSMSLIKGARNLEVAKKFYEWALTPAAQEMGAAAKQFQLPSNKAAKLDPRIPDFRKIKFINYDYAKYGASAERRRLIARWEKDVNSLPK